MAWQRTFATICALLLLLFLEPRLKADDLELTIDGSHFKVNGSAKFLVFVSYFDARHAGSTNLHSDFAYFKSQGVDGVRVFPSWWEYRADWPSTFYYAPDTVIDKDGDLQNWSNGPLDKLLEVLDIAKDEGLLVDLSFSAETVADCPEDNCVAGSPNISSLTLTEFTSGLEDLTTVLANAGSAYKHVLFDLQNECNLSTNGPAGSRPLSASQIGTLAEAVHAIDADRIVTASVEAGGYTATGAAGFANQAEIDVATWHEPSGSSTDPWWNHTYDWVGDMRGTTNLPVYLQEHERLRASGTPSENDTWFTSAGLRTAVTEAKRAGAAAWTFHTSAGYYLNNSSIQYHWVDTVESDFLDSLSDALNCVAWGSGDPCGSLAPQPEPSFLSQLFTTLRIPFAQPGRGGLLGAGSRTGHGPVHSRASDRTSGGPRQGANEGTWGRTRICPAPSDDV